MGMFDDLIPPKDGEGMFDDLVPKNSVGGTIRDTAVDLLGGAVDIGKQAYGLANVVSGGTLDPATRSISGWVDQNLVTPAYNFVTGENTQAQANPDSIAQGFEKVDKAIDGLHTDYRQHLQQQRTDAIQNADGTWDEVKAAVGETLSNPSLLLGDVTRSAASMLAPGAAASALTSKFGGQVAQTAAQRALAAGATRDVALEAGQAAANKLGERVVTGVTGLGQVGGGANIDAVNQILATKQAAMDANPRYNELIAGGMNDQAARDELARLGGLTSAAIAAPISMAASKLTGASSQLAQAATGSYAGRGIKDLAKAMGKEAAQEIPESGGERLAGNVAEQTFGDPSTETWKGVAADAVMGGLAGAFMGAGEHAFGGHKGGNEPATPPGRTAPLLPPPPGGGGGDDGGGPPGIAPPAGPLSAAAGMAGNTSLFPFASSENAQRQANSLANSNGMPYEVIDHPTVQGAFAARPVQQNAPDQQAGATDDPHARLSTLVGSDMAAEWIDTTPEDRRQLPVSAYVTDPARRQVLGVEGMNVETAMAKLLADTAPQGGPNGRAAGTGNMGADVSGGGRGSDSAGAGVQPANAMGSGVAGAGPLAGRGADAGALDAGAGNNGNQRPNADAVAFTNVGAAKVTPESIQPKNAFDLAAHESTNSPLNDRKPSSAAQNEAENYKVGRASFHGMPVAVENPKGSTRSGTDPDGNEWATLMPGHYGRFSGTTGADSTPQKKQEIDGLFGDNPDSKRVFVIDQQDPKTGKFDEHKVIGGTNSPEEAQQLYRDAYHDGWQGMKSITETTPDALRDWMVNGDTKKPFNPSAFDQATPTPTGSNPSTLTQTPSADPRDTLLAPRPRPYADRPIFWQDRDGKDIDHEALQRPGHLDRDNSSADTIALTSDNNLRTPEAAFAQIVKGNEAEGSFWGRKKANSAGLSPTEWVQNWTSNEKLKSAVREWKDTFPDAYAAYQDRQQQLRDAPVGARVFDAASEPQGLLSEAQGGGTIIKKNPKTVEVETRYIDQTTGREQTTSFKMPYEQVRLVAPSAPTGVTPSADTAAPSSLTGLLQSATRTLNIKGMEGERVPDPVAEKVLKSPDMGKLAQALSEQGVQPTGVLGAGASSIVLDAGDRALRLGVGENADVPKIDGMIQPIAAGTVGGLRYQVMPKADTSNITEDDVAQVSAQLRRQGYEFSDAGTDNVGKIDGKPVVIDPGAIRKLAEGSRPAQVPGNVPEPANGPTTPAETAPAKPALGDWLGRMNEIEAMPPGEDKFAARDAHLQTLADNPAMIEQETNDGVLFNVPPAMGQARKVGDPRVADITRRVREREGILSKQNVPKAGYPGYQSAAPTGTTTPAETPPTEPRDAARFHQQAEQKAQLAWDLIENLSQSADSDEDLAKLQPLADKYAGLAAEQRGLKDSALKQLGEDGAKSLQQEQKRAPLDSATLSSTLDALRAEAEQVLGRPVTLPTPDAAEAAPQRRAFTEAEKKAISSMTNRMGQDASDELGLGYISVRPNTLKEVRQKLLERDPDEVRPLLGMENDDDLATVAPTAPAAAAPFDSEKWNKDRDDRIKASKASGVKHLDDLEPYVETMRGKPIYNVHDPKERGVVRTVANTGEVVVNWNDDYSAQKNLASEKKKDGKKTVQQSWLMPTDLKDYAVGLPKATTGTTTPAETAPANESRQARMNREAVEGATAWGFDPASHKPDQHGWVQPRFENVETVPLIDDKKKRIKVEVRVAQGPNGKWASSYSSQVKDAGSTSLPFPTGGQRQHYSRIEAIAYALSDLKDTVPPEVHQAAVKAANLPWDFEAKANLGRAGIEAARKAEQDATVIMDDAYWAKLKAKDAGREDKQAKPTGTVTAKDLDAPLQKAHALLKTALGDEAKPLAKLAGFKHARLRQSVLSALEGRAVPAKSAGINRVRDTLYEHIGITSGTDAEKDAAFQQWFKNGGKVDVPSAGIPSFADMQAQITRLNAEKSAAKAAPAKPADIKTYTPKEAQAEWDGARAAKRQMVLARVDQRESALADKAWADMTPAERATVTEALNGDFESPVWYINKAGQQITKRPELAPPAKTAEQQAAETDAAAGQRWADLDPYARHRLLTRNGIGADADQGMYSSWGNLAPALRQRMTPTLLAEPAAPAAVAKAATPKKAIAPANVPNDERLLIVSCSDAKQAGRHPAKSLYTGALHQVLNKWMPAAGPDLHILSAKHGLVHGEALLTSYDQKMTDERAAELAARPLDLSAFKGKTYRDVFIAGSAQYRTVAEAYLRQLQAAGIVAPDATVNTTSGGIGDQRGQLGEYLRAIGGSESATVKAQPTPAKTASPARDRVKASDPFLALIAHHGVAMKVQADLGLEKGNKGNRMVPGYGPVLRHAGKNLDELATYAREAGFLTQADLDDPVDTGATEKLSDMIRRAVAQREVILPVAGNEDAYARDAEARVEAELRAEAESMGIDTSDMDTDAVATAVFAKLQQNIGVPESEYHVVEEQATALDGDITDVELDQLLDAALDHGAPQPELSDEEIDRLFASPAPQSPQAETFGPAAATPGAGPETDQGQARPENPQPPAELTPDAQGVVLYHGTRIAFLLDGKEREGQVSNKYTLENRQNGDLIGVRYEPFQGKRNTQAGRTDIPESDVLRVVAESPWVPKEDFTLSGQTIEEGRAAVAAAEARTAAERAAQAEARRKEVADRELGSYTLTGSDRPADLLAAQGQTSIFDMPAEPAKAEPSASQVAAALDRLTNEQLGAVARKMGFSVDAINESTRRAITDILKEEGAAVLEAAEAARTPAAAQDEAAPGDLTPEITRQKNPDTWTDGLPEGKERDLAIFNNVLGLKNQSLPSRLRLESLKAHIKTAQSRGGVAAWLFADLAQRRFEPSNGTEAKKFSEAIKKALAAGDVPQSQRVPTPDEYAAEHANPVKAAVVPKALPKSPLVAKAVAHVEGEANFRAIAQDHLNMLAENGYVVGKDEIANELDLLAGDLLMDEFKGKPPVFADEINEDNFPPLPGMETADWDEPGLERKKGIFPAPKATVSAVKQAAGQLLTQEQAAAQVAEWKAEAKRIGKTDANAKKVILSLFDSSGVWSQPYIDAGYTVIRYDLDHGDNLIEHPPFDDIRVLRAAGYEIAGVIAQPPCTSFAYSGVWSWPLQHDVASLHFTEKKYGAWATKYFDRPIDVADTLGLVAQTVVEFANPTEFYVIENPRGRIAERLELPQAAMVIQPHVYGDPYTKETFLYGEFNTALPTANVSPKKEDGGLGSKIYDLRGTDPEQHAERSLTPEGFAYAWFMANHDRQAVAPRKAEAKPAAAADKPAQVRDKDGKLTKNIEAVFQEHIDDGMTEIQEQGDGIVLSFPGERMMGMRINDAKTIAFVRQAVADKLAEEAADARRPAWEALGERVELLLPSEAGQNPTMAHYKEAAGALGLAVEDAKAAHDVFRFDEVDAPDYDAPGQPAADGDDPLFARRNDEFDRPLVDKATSRIFKREIANLLPAEQAAVDAFVKGRPDGAGLIERLQKHAGTPWAKQALEGVFIRQAILTYAAGGTPAFHSIMEDPSVHNLRRSLSKMGIEAVMRHVEANGFIGTAAKPINNVSSSFINCNPSNDCAQYCYATGNKYPTTNPMVKSELVTLAVERFAERSAKRTADEYKLLPEFAANKALRLFDKGDGDASWLPYIQALNTEGVRVQIFSKNPEFLRRVPNVNVRMLSIDQSNLAMADANPDLPVAFVYDKSEGQLAFLAKLVKRGQLAVVLPIKVGQRVLSKDEVKTLTHGVPGVGPYVCPVDAGFKPIGDRFSGKDQWNCTKCDDNGLLGCFFGSPNKLALSQAIEPKGSVQATLALQLQERINAAIRGQSQDAAGIGSALAATGQVSEAGVSDLLRQFDRVVGELFALYEPDAATRAALEGGDGAAAADRGEQGDSGRDGRRSIPIAKAKDKDGNPLASRGAPAPTSFTVDALQAALAPTVAQWTNAPAGGIHAVQSVRDLPPALIARIPTAALRDLRGVFDPATEAVYLVADRLQNAREAEFVLGHEVLGHVGLRTLLGKRELANELNRLRLINPALAAEARSQAQKFGLDITTATEEALADWQGEGRPLKGWQAFMARVQKALRAIGLSRFADWLEGKTQAETLALLKSARESITGTGVPGVFGAADALRYSSDRATRWQSALADQIGKMPTKVAPAGQWLNALNGLQAKGVKKDEIEWSGIKEWLTLQDGKVTKEQVLDFLADSGVKVEEVIRGEPDPAYEAKKAELEKRREAYIEEAVEEARKEFESGIDYAVSTRMENVYGSNYVRTGTYDDGETVWEHASEYNDEPIGTYDTEEEAQAAVDAANDYEMSEAERDIRNDIGAFDEDQARGEAERNWEYEPESELEAETTATEFSNWRTVPGGDEATYRELLITMGATPGGQILKRRAVFEKYAPQISGLEVQMANVIRQGGDDTAARWDALNNKLDTVRSKRDLEAKAAAGEVDHFMGDHWRQGSVLAHVRFDVRTNAAGESVLQVHEIQSDWAEQGRAKGFEDDRARELATVRDEMATLGGATGVEQRMNDLIDAYYERTGMPAFDQNGRGMPGFENNPEADEWNRLAGLAERELELRNQRGLPVAPFVKKTEAWVSLALKRVMSYAAEKGIAHVALPTGDQANAAFSLEKQVQIEYKKKTDGKIWLHVTRAGDGATVTERTVALEDLPGIVGKEVAQKMERGEGEAKYDPELQIIQKRGEPTEVFQGDDTNYGESWYIRYASGAAGTGIYPNRAAAERGAEQVREMLREGVSTVLAGDDLKIGGDPMRKYYDAMVVNIANDLLKKFGGERVKPMEVGKPLSLEVVPFGLPPLRPLGSTEPVRPQRYMIHDRTTDRFMFDNPASGPEWVSERVEAKALESRAEAERVMAQLNARPVQSQPAFAITDALRDRALRGLPLFSRADGEEDADGNTRSRATPGANVERLAGLLGPQLYGDMTEMGPVTVKELFQNSFDALKGALEAGHLSAGQITITTDRDSRTVTIADNGTGMTPAIINKAFLTIAGTNKETERSSGGFGIAKMLFLFGNEHLKLVTVRDGVEATLETTGQQLMKSFNDPDAAPEIVTRKTDAPSGTTVTVKIPANFKNPSTGTTESISFPDGHSVKELLHKSPLFENISVNLNGTTLPIGAAFPKDDFTTFSTVDFDWGKARVIVSKQETPGSWGSNVHVLSNGLWQFGFKIKENPFDYGGDNIPRQFYINVEPRVKPEEAGYPFALNRQGFSPAVKSDFDKISNYISVLYGSNKAAENAAGFGQVEYVNDDHSVSDKLDLAPKLDDAARSNMLQINEGDKIEIHEGRMTVNGREVPALTRADIEKVKVDVTKFKIDQGLVDPSRPMIHDNLDVKIIGSAADRAELERLREVLEDARMTRAVLRDVYEQASKKRDNTAYSHPDYQAISTASSDAFSAWADSDGPVDEAKFAVEDFQEKMRASAVPTPITTVMREKYGARFDRYLGDIGRQFMRLRDAAVAEDSRTYGRMAEVPVGVSFDQEYYGVHTMTPFRGMFLNPAMTSVDDPGHDGPRASTKLIATTMVGTMVHEIAHFAEMNHSTRFISEMQRILAVLESSDTFNLSNLRQELRSILDKNHDIYTDLNRIVRGDDVANRGVKLADSSSYSARNEGAADPMGGAGAAGPDDGRVAGRPGRRAGAAADLQDGGRAGGQAAGAGDVEPLYSRSRDPGRHPAILQAMLRGGSINDLLRAVAQHADDPALAKVARHLAGLNLPTTFQAANLRQASDDAPVPVGVYHLGRDAITLDPARANEHTIVHEAVHAATHWALTNGATHNDAQTDAAYTLFRLYDEVMAHPDAGKQYGMTNISEFVAEALTNGDFQHFLAQTDGLWQRFVTGVRNLLGMKPATNLDRIMRASWSLVDSVAETGRPNRHLGSGIDTDPVYSRGRESFQAFTDTLRSGTTLRTLTAQAREAMSSYSAFNKFNWYDKTLSTQYNKARKDADFRAVFTPALQQVDDTAHFAIEAETQAPDVLLRMDGAREWWAAFKRGGTAYAADMKAIARPLFANIEGRVGIQQVRYTANELRRDFGLNEQQVGLYEQVRNAVDTSIDRLAQTSVMTMGQRQGLNVAALKDQSLEDTIATVKQGIIELHEERRLREEAEAQLRGDETIVPPGPAQARLPGVERIVRHNERTDGPPETALELLERIDKIAETAGMLKLRAYMPAMRFGQYAITIRDPNAAPRTPPLYFNTYESQFAAHAAYQRLVRDFPGMDVQRSTLNDEHYQMFKGVSPETMELFAKFMDLPLSDAMQDYIALAKASRSARMHELNRQGVAGFSEDVSRVAAAFLLSNARQSAINVNGQDITDALARPSLAAKGDVQKEAERLIRYMNNPTEEARAARSMLFTYFIGGSVASAVTNLSQPVLQTLPWLTEFVGARAVPTLLAAAKMAATGRIGNRALAEAFQRADADGLTQPKEIHSLMADADASVLGTNVRVRALLQAWGGFFGQAEAYNRRVTFLAAYQAALDMGIPALRAKGFADEYDFAKRAINETQGLYAKVNRPNWGRGPVGALLLTFKQFSITYLEMLNRMPLAQKGIALALLTLAAGLEGWPFAEDIEDLIDTLGQSMGYNTNSKKALRQAAEKTFGELGAHFLLKGATGLTGADLSGRIGLGNLIPGTDLFKQSDQRASNSSPEALGAFGSLVQAAHSGFMALQSGDVGGAVRAASPTAVRNALQGIDMATSGVYHDTRHRNVMPVSQYESALKFFGFQPDRVAHQSDIVGDLSQDKAMMGAVKSSLLKRWAGALVEQDGAKVQETVQKWQQWNLANPDYKLIITPAEIRTQVRELTLARDMRTIRAMPPTMRGEAVRELK